MAGLTLLVALLRYAIDLLGVVFVIILVGFAIRAVSDWVTEGQSVSVWAISALSLGLTGTVLVGLWLFSSGDMGSQAIPNVLPGPMQQTVAWLESKGWGQRVLLSGSSASGSIGRDDGGGRVPSGGGGSSGSAAETSAPAEPIRMPAAPRPAPALPEKRVVEAPSGSRASTARRSAPGAAEAAPPIAAPAAAAPAPAAPSASPVPVAATVTLSSSPAHAVVGSSVRLTAQVRGQGAGPAPSGTVVFTADDRVLGHAQVRGGVATLVTLDLGIGEHTLSATYEGDGSHQSGRSASILQTVARK